MHDATDIELRLVDPAKNRFRLYGITECRTLFGELCLRVVWGRIGHRTMRERSETFTDERELSKRRAELLARRRRRGYAVVSQAAPRKLTPRHDTALGSLLASPPPVAPGPSSVTRERAALAVARPAATRLPAAAGERELVEAHGLQLRDAVAHALVEQWLRATRDLSDYLEERTPDRLDLVDVSTLAALYSTAAGIA